MDQLDLLGDREATLRKVFVFLGVDPDFSTPEFGLIHNRGDLKVRYGRAGIWLMKRQIFTHRRTRTSRGPLIRPLRSLLSKSIDTWLPSEMVERLVDHLTPEVHRLREMTGQPFASWPRFPASGVQPPTPLLDSGAPEAD